MLIEFNIDIKGGKNNQLDQLGFVVQQPCMVAHLNYNS